VKSIGGITGDTVIGTVLMNSFYQTSEKFIKELLCATFNILYVNCKHMVRLVKAGYATRRSESINGRIKYFYEPIFSEKEIATKITNRILDRLVDAFGPLALENFSKYSDKK
jgi:hypothetical protein